MYTYENWKQLKKDLNLSNKDIAEITGTSLQNVSNQISPKKKLPSWARAMIFVWNNQGIDINSLEVITEQEISDKVFNPETINLGNKVFSLCGCSYDNGLFRRDKNCLIDKKDHKI